MSEKMTQTSISFPIELRKSIDETRRPNESFAEVVRAACVHWVDHHEDVRANRRYFTRSLRYSIERQTRVLVWCTLFITNVIIEVVYSIGRVNNPDAQFPDAARLLQNMLRVTSKHGLEIAGRLETTFQGLVDELELH